MGRLRRGHSLEVIFEEETAEFQPSIARLEEEELTDEWKNYRRLSRRQILFQQQQESGPASSSSVQVTLCSQCCHPTEMQDSSSSHGSTTMDQTTTTTTGHLPARRRNSTYLALACANAVSQGAMTRSLRQMFETQPVRETQPLLSRAEIKQQIQAARLRRNSIAVLYPSGASGSPEPDTNNLVTAIPAVVVDAVPTKQPPPTPAKPTTTTATTVSSTPPSTPPFKLPASPVYNAPADSPSSPLCIRCDKCSSILTSPPVAVSLVIHSGKSLSAAVTQPTTTVHPEMAEEKQAAVEERTPSPSKIIPTNREVVEEELPKPDTVKNARCLFESSFMEASSNGVGNFSTLQHVKSNPSSKILRSESSMTLDRCAGTRSSSVASRPPPFRWPSRQEHARNRSPSPSPSPSPIPALVIPATKSHHHHKMTTSSTLPSYYRSSPSLTQYRSSRHSLHSTDVESYVSEGGSDCWSSSDLESEASYSSLSGVGGVGGTGRDDLSDSLDGMRYISPDVMEKIRSYGMTLTFVNGKMVDEDDDDLEEPEVMAKEAATRKVVQSIRSAGQSQPITATTTKSTPPVAPKKSAIKQQQQQQQTKEKLLKSASPPPRIVACLPKQETVEKAAANNNNNSSSQFTKKIRHSSGESSASSGVSSGTNAGSDSSSSEHNSPFASLKRTKSANADHTVERSPSPGPRQSGTRKAVGSSPFGCYSVVYSFNASARSPMYV